MVPSVVCVIGPRTRCPLLTSRGEEVPADPSSGAGNRSQRAFDQVKRADPSGPALVPRPHWRQCRVVRPLRWVVGWGAGRPRRPASPVAPRDRSLVGAGARRPSRVGVPSGQHHPGQVGTYRISSRRPMTRVSMVEGRALTRFRCDPYNTRTSIWRVDDLWCVQIQERRADGTFGRSVRKFARQPRSAVLGALLSAERAGLQGIDLGMQRSYSHPQFGRRAS